MSDTKLIFTRPDSDQGTGLAVALGILDYHAKHGTPEAQALAAYIFAEVEDVARRAIERDAARLDNAAVLRDSAWANV